MPKHWLGEREEVTRMAGAPQREINDDVTGVVIDMELEDKIREILQHDLFMRAADVDAIFELARRWDLSKPKPKMLWPVRA